MLNTLVKDFFLLFSIDGILSLFHIIMIDIVLSGDNAIVIGMATKKLTGQSRKKAILLGVLGATILRIILAFFAVFLMKIIGIQVAGALLLLYVVWKFYTELRGEHKEEENALGGGADKLISAIKLIIIADISMSLDNVLAVAGAAKENVVALGIGLIISIILMAFASNFIAKKMEKFPQIQWVGLLIILLVSIEMLLTGLEKVDSTLHIATINFIGFIFFGIFLFIYSKMKHMKLPKKHFLHGWKYGTIVFFPLAFGIILLSLLSFFHIFSLDSNLHILYTAFILVIVIALEYLWTLRGRKI